MTERSDGAPLRAGVVGAGVFGRFHAQKYAALPGVTLVGVADPAPDAAAALGNALGVPAFADHRDLIGQVDCVSICSPAVTHGTLAEDLLRAGIDVYVEKPLATTLEEADRLIALAAGNGRLIKTGHQERYVFEATGLLDWQVAPTAITCVRAGPFSGRGTDVSAALDLMIHDLDLVHVLNPAPVAAVAGAARHLPSSFSDEVTAELTLADGCAVSLLASRMADARRRVMRLTYPDGAVEIDFIARTVANSTPRPLSGALFADPASGGPAADPLGFAIARFIDAVRTRRTPKVAPAEARRALETALLILAAAGCPGTRTAAIAA